MITLSEYPGVLDAVARICNDGDPVRTMLLLTDMTIIATRNGIITSVQLELLSDVHNLLGEIALLKLSAIKE